MAEKKQGGKARRPAESEMEAGRANQAAEGIDRADEARNLAKEAVEEMRHGDREEGEFLAEEAKALDEQAAGEVLKQDGKGSGKKE